LFIALAGCKQHYDHPRIIMETKLGDIEIELYPDKAPKTVAAFLRYVDSGYYTNSNFYRILTNDNQPMDAPKSQLIQGGIWLSNHKLSTALPGIQHETTKQTGILHTNGTISLARTTPGTATTEFFICVGDQHGFDYGGGNNPDGQGYAAFGRVIKGMDIVRAIYHAPEDDQVFTPPVDIFSIEKE
jgi:peptidyl-prolyl cis-trans isomerase A (cyclophilin A)